MKRFWILVLLVSLGLNVGLGARLLTRPAPDPGTRAAARRGPGVGGPGWERRAGADSTAWRRVLDRRLEHLTARLDLRPDQVAAFRAVQQEMGGALRAKREQLLAAREHLRATIGAGPVDRAGLSADLVEIGRHQAEMDSLAAASLLRELETLDPEQRAAYLDFLPAAGSPRSGHGRRGAGRRGR